jgi:arylsulfatase
MIIVLLGTVATWIFLQPKQPTNSVDVTSVGVRPNIILLVVDTLRADHLGCYGYVRNTSGNVDKFASEAVLFENAFSQAAVTCPSTSSILSGFLPHETKVMNNTTVLPTEVNTIAEVLQATGYHTYAVVSNWVLQKKYKFDQGFDIYDDHMTNNELNREIPERIAEHTTSRAMEILKQHVNGNFFLYLHYQDPHGPYIPMPPYDKMFTNHGKEPRPMKISGKDRPRNIASKGHIPPYQKLGDNTDYHYYVSQYDGEIAYFDEYFGRLIEGLRELGFYDNSLIILTADHGEAMGESNRFFGHGHSLSHDQIHVPLIVKHPDLAPGRKKECVQLLDVAPTIMKSAGIAPGIEYRGRSLLDQYSRPEVVCSEWSDKGTAIIVDGLKLIMYGSEVMLFDILKDPMEQNDLAVVPANRKDATVLIEHVTRLRQEDFVRVTKNQQSTPLTEDEKAKLRSLGYLQ